MLLRRRTSRPRVLVIGLDCASPALLFDRLRGQLPAIGQLMARGVYGVLRSCVPCITVPAWSAMLSSRDPGTLGLYGFRNRAGWGYDALIHADGGSLQHPRVWDVLGEAGRSSLVVNVPQTFPVRPMQGRLVSDFLTPDTSHGFTFPPPLRVEVLRLAPDYAFDVPSFRTLERGALAARLTDLADVQYRVFDHLLETSEWDLAIHVNIGMDRVQHGFWRYFDPAHRCYETGVLSGVIPDYYRQVDAWIGRLLRHVDDHTSVLIVSDHGAVPMDGAVAINGWLWRRGWLTLVQPPQQMTPFHADLVDWSRTRAWSTGGYYGRIFLNIAGREPQGIVPPDAVDETLAQLVTELATLTDDSGRHMPVRAMRPQDIYQQVNGHAPDLIVYFGDLRWRTVGGVGYASVLTPDNDAGIDDINHAEEGLYVWVPAAGLRGQQGAEQQLMNIAPTVLNALRVPAPPGWQGSAIQP